MRKQVRAVYDAMLLHVLADKAGLMTLLRLAHVQLQSMTLTYLAIITLQQSDWSKQWNCFASQFGLLIPLLAVWVITHNMCLLHACRSKMP